MRSVEEPTRPAVLAHDLGEATVRLRRVLRRAVRSKIQPSGASSAEIELLVAVVDSGGLRVSEAAARLGLAVNTVSTLAASAVNAGLIERAEDENDRRVVVLQPSSAGRARVRRWRSTRTSVIAEAIARLSPHDRHRIASAIEPLRKLAAELESSEHTEEA